MQYLKDQKFTGVKSLNSDINDSELNDQELKCIVFKEYILDMLQCCYLAVLPLKLISNFVKLQGCLWV